MLAETVHPMSLERAAIQRLPSAGSSSPTSDIELFGKIEQQQRQHPARTERVRRTRHRVVRRIVELARRRG